MLKHQSAVYQTIILSAYTLTVVSLNNDIKPYTLVEIYIITDIIIDDENLSSILYNILKIKYKYLSAHSKINHKLTYWIQKIINNYYGYGDDVWKCGEGTLCQKNSALSVRVQVSVYQMVSNTCQ